MKNECLTLAELAEQEGITQDAARKRADRGWYEKIKLHGRTFYRKHRQPEPEPEPLPTAPEPVQDEPRPEQEPFLGAWEIADVDYIRDYFSWRDVEAVGKELNGDGEAVCRWFNQASNLQAAILAVNHLVKSGKIRVTSRTPVGDAIQMVVSAIVDWYHDFLTEETAKWLELGKPRVAPAAVLEQMKNEAES